MIAWDSMKKAKFLEPAAARTVRTEPETDLLHLYAQVTGADATQ